MPHQKKWKVKQWSQGKSQIFSENYWKYSLYHVWFRVEYCGRPNILVASWLYWNSSSSCRGEVKDWISLLRKLFLNRCIKELILPIILSRHQTLSLYFIIKVGHYTQMVWSSSHKVGCGFTKCVGSKPLMWKKYYSYICNYCPQWVNKILSHDEDFEHF